MAYIRKTTDEWSLYGTTEIGQEELAASDTHKGIREHMREYRENQPELAPFTIKKHRIPKLARN